ncbi:MAG: hypothetical protein Q8O43_05850 [Dehalococcoidia bacterium]|nr:hypothetical protein [Dehalococcoidia bacterium]
MAFIDIEKILTFFDEKPENSKRHATAICAVAGEDLGISLLKHYFECQGSEVRILPDACTTGEQKGPRLDRWLLVIGRDKRTLYQVEIKNWSAHAIGGKCIGINANEQKLSAYKIERWAHEWRNNNFTKKQVKKVLTPMRLPAIEHDVHEPLVCYWTALHPDGLNQPFFSLKVVGSEFPLVYVFSMSIYLRSLRQAGLKRLELHMPDASRRYDWLQQLFGFLDN